MDAKRGIAIRIAMLATASIATAMAFAVGPAFADSESDESAPLLQPTPFQTPTPNAQGAILYVVLDGDSLWRIAAIAEISVEELMALNASGVDLGVVSGTAWHDDAKTVTVTITTNADFTSVNAGTITCAVFYWAP